MDKKLLFLICFFIFIFTATAQEITKEEACTEYFYILTKADTTFAQMRACDSAIAEIQSRISKGGISEQNELLMYQEIVETKKEKILLEVKLKEYGILAKQLKYQCENN